MITLIKILVIQIQNSIKSYLLRETWRKTYEYGLGIIVIVIFESLIFGVTPITLLDRTFSIAELSVLIPAAVELWSIYENMEAVSGRNIFKRLVFILPAPIKYLFTGKEGDVKTEQDYE